MTRDECKKILMIIDATFPNFKVNNASETLDAWYFMLKDFDYTAIANGLRVFVATSGSAFAPSVSELIESAREPAMLNENDAVSAWNQVRKAIKDSYYHAEEHFAEFDETTKQVVGNPSQLRSWGQMESTEVDSVVWSNFKRSYEIVQTRNMKKQVIQNSLGMNDQALLESVK